MLDSIHHLARAIIIDQHHILLCRSATAKHNFYFLPGGHVEPGEDSESALLRELQEEIGQLFVIDRLLGDFDYQFVPNNLQKACHTHERNVVYLAHASMVTVDKPLVQQENHIEFIWMPLVQLDEIELKPEIVKTFIKQWGLVVREGML